jgi:ADP-ribose pyrophosphatase YjhB (NUDIX family)
MIEFVRGKYDVTNFDYIIKLFNMMTFDEKRILREYDSFDMIRTSIGLKKEYNYKTEYENAKNKFMILKQNPICDQVNSLLDKSYTKWTTPEWGIPKGRRNNWETDIECAIREFVEETGIKYKNINVYRNIKPVEELYTGINGVIYKHIYFIADIKDTPDSHENINRVEKGGFINYEISNIKLFSLTESHKLIRPYYVSKLNAIKKGFQITEAISTYFE